MDQDAKDESHAHISKLETLLQKAKSKVTPEVKSLSAIPSHQFNFEDEAYLDLEEDQAAWDDELPQNPLLESSNGDCTYLDKLAKYQINTGENSSEGDCQSNQGTSESDQEFSDGHSKNEYLPFPTSGVGSDAGSDFRAEPAIGGFSTSLDSEMFLITDPRNRKEPAISKYVQYMGAAEEYDSSVEDFAPLSDIISLTDLDLHLSELPPAVASVHLNITGAPPVSEPIQVDEAPNSSVEPPQLLITSSRYQYEDFVDYDEEAGLLHYDKQPATMTSNNAGRKVLEPTTDHGRTPWYAQWFCCVPSSVYAP